MQLRYIGFFVIFSVFALAAAFSLENQKPTSASDKKISAGNVEFFNGLVIANAKKGVYLPGETAEILVVVLDKTGKPVDNAQIALTVSQDSGSSVFSTEAGEIHPSGNAGVYRAFYKILKEGNYYLSVEAIVENKTISFKSFFVANSSSPFIVSSSTPGKIDPTAANSFKAVYDIETLAKTKNVTIRQLIPSSFTVIDSGGAEIVVDSVTKERSLVWNKILKNNRTSIGFTFSVPSIWPTVYTLQPLQVDYGNDLTFVDSKPWFIAVDPLSPSGRGLFVYADSTTAGKPRQRNWTGTALQAEEDLATDYGNTVAWVKLISVKQRNEFLLLADEATDLDINFEAFNIRTRTWNNATQLTGADLDVLTPHFDIACEDSRGDCLVVYDNSTSNCNVYYRIWNSSGLGAEQTLTAACGVLGTAEWIALYPKNNSNDIMMGIEDSNLDIRMYLWNGTSRSFTNTRVNITLAAPLADRKSFDFAWEGSSGDGLVIFGNTTNGAWGYSYAASTDSWTAINGTLWTLGEASTLFQVEMCGSSPENAGLNHDNIGVIVHGSLDHVDVRIWSGTAIESSPSPPTSEDAIEEDYPTNHIDCAWEASSKNQAVFVWNDLNSLIPESAVYTTGGTGWRESSLVSGTSVGQSWTDDVESLRLVSKPGSDNMSLYGVDLVEDTFCTMWNSTNWSGAGCGLVDGSGTNGQASISAGFDWERFTPSASPYHENTNGGTPTANDTTPNPGDKVNFTSFWYDGFNLDSYWTQWNGTGGSGFTNTSPVSIFSSGNQSWANVTVTILGADEGKSIYGVTWANDSDGSINHTFNGSENYVILAVQNVSPTVTSTAVNTTSTQASTAICVNFTATDVGVGVDKTWIQITYPNATIQNRTLSDDSYENCASAAGDNKYGLAFDVGSTTGTLTVNRSYANDTLNNVGRQSPDAALNVTVTSATTVSFTLFILSSSNTTANSTAPPGAPPTPAINFSYAGADGIDSNRNACNTEASPTCQDASNSIFLFFNTGTVSVNWLMALNVSIPSGIKMFCDTDSDPSGAVELTTSYQTLASGIPASGNQKAWCWANFSLADTGIQARLLQHNASQ